MEAVENVRIADIDPLIINFNDTDNMIGLNQSENGICEFIFTPGGLCESGGMIEDIVGEKVDSSVVVKGPILLKLAGLNKLVQLICGWFFDEAGEAHGGINQEDAPFLDFLTSFSRHQSIPFAGLITSDEFSVGASLDEDVAVGQEKWGALQCSLGQFRSFSSTILHSLPRVLDVDTQSRTITEKFLNDFGLVTRDDHEIGNTSLLHSFNDMEEDWFATHLKHGFGDIVSQATHSGTFSGSKNNSSGVHKWFHQNGGTHCS